MLRAGLIKIWFQVITVKQGETFTLLCTVDTFYEVIMKFIPPPSNHNTHLPNVLLELNQYLIYYQRVKKASGYVIFRLISCFMKLTKLEE